MTDTLSDTPTCPPTSYTPLGRHRHKLFKLNMAYINIDPALKKK
jgi:hypothetical protein